MSVTRLSGGLTPADGTDPRTFPTIWNATAGQIETAQSNISALQSADVAQDLRLDTVESDVSVLQGTTAGQGSAISVLQGDVLTLQDGLVSLGTSTGGTVSVSFSDSDALISHEITGSSVAVEGSDYTSGATKTIRLFGGTAVASLTVPAGWVFVGNAAGTSIGTATTVIVTATSFGTAATDVVAAYAEQA